MTDTNSGGLDKGENDLDQAASNGETQYISSGDEHKVASDLNPQEQEAIRRMTDPDMIRMYGYRTDDGGDTIDIIMDGTCFRVTYVDEYGEEG